MKNRMLPLVAVTLVLTSCSSAGTDQATSTAVPDAESVALEALKPHCNESTKDLKLFASNTLGIFKKDGINDETELSVIQHVTSSIPDGMAKTKCLDLFAAYATLRDPN